MIRFCSRACSRAFLQAQKPRAVCGYCTQSFALSPSHNYTFCSRACQRAGRLLARTRRCVFCLEAFEAAPHRTVVHCSKACEVAAKVAARRCGAQEPPPVEGARWIALTHGAFTLVDAADYERLARHVWGLDAAGYASTKVDGRRVQIHQLLLGPLPVDRVGDHKNRHPLDNRRANLRAATYAENKMNSQRGCNNTSGFKGVHRHRSGQWVARLGVGRRRIYMGMYPTVEDAARAYDVAARKHYGDVAVLNFPADPATVAGVREK